MALFAAMQVDAKSNVYSNARSRWEKRSQAAAEKPRDDLHHLRTVLSSCTQTQTP